MSISNPSHLLISRNPPRSPAHPQLAPTSTSRHATNAPPPPPGIAGPWTQPDEAAAAAARQSTYLSTIENEVDPEDVDIHPTFRRDSLLPGRVRVVVGRHEFWCHKEVLWFASPFFQALLQGSWAETNQVYSPAVDTFPSPSPSSPTDTDPSNLPPVPEIPLSPISDDNESKKVSVVDATDDGPSVADILRELRELPDSPLPDTKPPMTPYDDLSEVARPRSPLPILLQRHSSRPLAQTITTASPRRQGSGIRHSFSSVASPARPDSQVEATVELHEESASAFQDFLFWAYPHLECKVTWTNVENLLALSSKLIVPSLQKLCAHFLLTHASGNPVMALKLAEQHVNGELYREASRFVLDQPTGGDQGEMDCLSEQTQLKLSKRRSWFLERLLKLGSIDVKKQYTCRPDCPDPARCQTQLDEKWRQAHSAVCRYGPPQPSVAFRCLRQLETFPTNPSLVMSHPLCQSAAKLWVMTLFDRMFQPKMVFSPLNPGTEKYWLWISMT